MKAHGEHLELVKLVDVGMAVGMVWKNRVHTCKGVVGVRRTWSLGSGVAGLYVGGDDRGRRRL